MDNHYEPPEVDKDAFTCPHCGAFSAMRWERLRTNREILDIQQAVCHRCRNHSIWRFWPLGDSDAIEGQMVYPDAYLAPTPNEDLPEICRRDYLEAREIAAKSPRGAAALLRLCIQKLCGELGERGKNINDDIAALVSKGLPQTIQQALDVVRVVGNNAVHPGEISTADQAKTVSALFNLVNLIVENRITQPKQVAELFESLPERAQSAVAKRDGEA